MVIREKSITQNYWRSLLWLKCISWTLTVLTHTRRVSWSEHTSVLMDWDTAVPLHSPSMEHNHTDKTTDSRWWNVVSKPVKLPTSFRVINIITLCVCVCVDTRGSVKQTAQFMCRLNDCVWCWCVSELHHQHTQEMSRGTQIISTMNTKT